MTFNLGDRVRCTGTLAQTDGTLLDPSTVKAWHRSPIATLTTLTYGVDVALVKDAIGVYYFDLDVDIAGLWIYGFYSLGAGKAASPDTILTVAASERQ